MFVHGVTHCFGLVFNDFLKETGAGTGIFPVLNSCTYGAISVAGRQMEFFYLALFDFFFKGLSFHSLTHKFSKRMVGLIGATCYCIGGFFQLFATSIAPLFVAFILNGKFSISIIYVTMYYIEAKTKTSVKYYHQL